LINSRQVYVSAPIEVKKVEREIGKQVYAYLNLREPPYNTLIVQGARQVGKTHLVQSILKSCDHKEINLEKQPDVRMALDEAKNFEQFSRRLFEYSGFKPESGQVLYIDEAQESETIGRYVRHFKEDWQNTKVILSGSSMNRLFRGEQRVPVGRIEYLNVHPFSFREYMRFVGLEALLDQFKEDLAKRFSDKHLHEKLLQEYDKYLLVGGMPEAVKASVANASFERIHQMILASQAEDFGRKEPIDDHLFMDAFRALCHHVGDISHYSHLPTTQYKAKRTIELLKKWFIVIEVPQLGSTPSQKFSPKRYLYDIGILRSYRELSIPRISLASTLGSFERTPLGGLIENAICLSLLARNASPAPLSGWKKDKKHPIEVDFVFKLADGARLPIEVKASLQAQNKHLNSLSAYCERHSPETAVLVSLANFQQLPNLGKTKTFNLPAYGLGEFLDLHENGIIM